MLNKILKLEQKTHILILRIIQLVLMFIPGSLVCINAEEGHILSETALPYHWSNETGRKICSMVGSAFLRPGANGEHYMLVILMGLMVFSVALSL